MLHVASLLAALWGVRGDLQLGKHGSQLVGDVMLVGAAG